FGDTRLIFSGCAERFVLAGLAEDKRVNTSDSIVTIGRSTTEGHAEFEQVLQTHIDPTLRVHTIRLRQPFYHMDTTGIPTRDGVFFTNRAAYAPESWALLQ